MRSLKYTIMLTFGLLTLLSMIILGGVVSWKLAQSIEHQTNTLTSMLTERTYENLSSPQELFLLRVRAVVRTAVDELRHESRIVEAFESRQYLHLTSELDAFVRKKDLDFGLLLTRDGHLQASIPGDVNEPEIETYFSASHLGEQISAFLAYNPDNVDKLWDELAQFDGKTLDMLKLTSNDLFGRGTIGSIAAGMISDDFGNPLGICVVGKLFNDYVSILDELYQTGNYAGLIYSGPYPLAYAGVSSATTMINVATLQLEPELQKRIYTSRQTEHVILDLAGQSYLAACSPLMDAVSNPIGAFCVGLPEAQVSDVQTAISTSSTATRHLIEHWFMGVGVLVLCCFTLASLVAATRITTPIMQLSAIARVLATGNFRQDITVTSRDEVGVLADAFRELTAYIREVASVADEISQGHLHLHVTPRSDDDTLNQSFERMIAYIQDVEHITQQIAENNLDVNVSPKSDQDVLNLSLQHMVAHLQEASAVIAQSVAEIEDRNWLKSGQAELSAVMRGEQNSATLARNVITFVAKYIQAQVGTLYLTNDEEQVLYLAGSYAYTVRKGNRNVFRFGEGLVGQAALERQYVLFTNVPDDYLAVASGIGEATPRQIFILPFWYGGDVKGVLEVGTVEHFSERQRTFLKQIAEHIAIAIHSTQVRERMQNLLEQTQQQAEELQAQQEELRVTNEELEAQTDALRKSEQKLHAEQEELRQTNEALGERTEILEQQHKALQDKNLDLENARALLEEKAEELEISSKYKSEFLANMSHELRTPLNSLLILSKLLCENRHGNLSDKQVEYADTIYAAGIELLDLINEVLDLSKVEAGKMSVNLEDMSVKGIMNYVDQNFRHIADQRGLRLRLDVDDNAPAAIRTDRQRVEQILKNLLSNAMKFTERGEVAVRIFRPDPGMVFPRSGLQAGQAVGIAVSDTGIGIPVQKQQLIFEAFQQIDGTTNRRYGGTGLGLSIVKEFSRLLGGEIHLSSEDGQGSTFTVFLPEQLAEPAREEPSVSAMETRTSAIIPSQTTALSPLNESRIKRLESIRDDRHSKITPSDNVLLIIEDDPTFARVLFELARERGFKGLLAGDGAAGLQLAYQYLPSAILLDIELPGMDGWNVMEKLKADPDARHIPIHFISALDQANKAKSLGAIGYLTKPVTIEQLTGVFQTLEHEISDSIKKLLIVEDDEATRLSLIEMLRTADVDITEVTTGKAAYDALRHNAFDCMVLDLGLDDMPGLDFLRQIHDDLEIERLPIIIYTAQDLTKDEEQQLHHHAESIVIKGAKSRERLMDEVTLFLHRIETKLPETQQKKIRILHDKEAVLSDKTVLIVDDDMRNVFALSSVLEGKGVQVVVAEHGREALRILDQRADIHIVLMDIMMPEMDGYETIGQIRKHPQHRQLPVIALTAKAMKGDRQRCIDAGANDYLSKPVDTDKLLSLLRVWLY